MSLGEGDPNTKFCHRIANLEKKFNLMSAVMIEENCYETIENMKSSIHDFYKELFYETEPQWPKVDGLSLPSLPTSAREVLEMQFDEEKVSSI